MVTKKIIYGCESDGTENSPYLTRHTLLEGKGGSLCLHVFHRSDREHLHCHPWDFWTLILWRGYNEVTPAGTRRVWPGMLLRRPATWRHRVELTREDCEFCKGTGDGMCGDGPFGDCADCRGTGYRGRPAVTLLWKSKRIREWGFFLPTGWQDWRTYFREKGC